MESVGFWIAVAAVVLALGSLVVIWNLLIGLRNDIRRAWANVDVILQQRHDEVGNLVGAVRDYMTYEQELLENITEARNRLARAVSVKAKAGQDQVLRQQLSSLFATVENYPDLKANHLVLDLMRRVSQLEDLLADRREMYNSTVTEYNTMIQVVPITFVSGAMGFRDESLFEADDAARVAPVVKLRS